MKKRYSILQTYHLDTSHLKLQAKGYKKVTHKESSFYLKKPML